MVSSSSSAVADGSALPGATAPLYGEGNEEISNYQRLFGGVGVVDNKDLAATPRMKLGEMMSSSGSLFAGPSHLLPNMDILAGKFFELCLSGKLKDEAPSGASLDEELGVERMDDSSEQEFSQEITATEKSSGAEGKTGLLGAAAAPADIFSLPLDAFGGDDSAGEAPAISAGFYSFLEEVFANGSRAAGAEPKTPGKGKKGSAEPATNGHAHTDNPQSNGHVVETPTSSKKKKSKSKTREEDD